MRDPWGERRVLLLLLHALAPHTAHAAGLREQVQRRCELRRVLVEDFLQPLPSLRRHRSARSRRGGWFQIALPAARALGRQLLRRVAAAAAVECGAHADCQWQRQRLYTESDRSSLQQKVANVAGVDKSLVKINVTASSVLITATIAVPASMTADQVKTSLSSSLGTADAASIALGITVEAVPNIIIKGPPPSPPPSILSVSCAALDDRTTCTKEDSKTVHRRCSPSAKTGWGGVDHKKCAKLCKNMDERLSAKCKQACCVTPPPSPPPSPESCDDPSFTLPACVAGVKPTADHPGSTKKDKFCVSNTLVTCAVSCGTCSPPPPPSPEA